MENTALPATTIRQYKFNKEGAEELLKTNKGIDWPVVYILDGKDGQKSVAYVGETSSAYNRMLQHLDNVVRKSMINEYVLFNDMFNKSAILDIENMLIEHMHANGKFELQNLNNGQSKFHNYYQRGLYKELFKRIWKQLKKEGLADKTLLQVENSKIFKYSPFKQLTDEQYDLEVKLLDDITETLKSGQKRNIIVEGGAGTGKSILAVSLIKYIADVCTQKVDYSDIESIENLESTISYMQMNKEIASLPKPSIAFVAPMTEFKNTVKSVFKNIPSLKNVDVVSPVDLTKKKEGYDIVLVDEAHHLATYGKSTSHLSFKQADDRLGFTDYENTTQLDWIKKQAKHVAIFFYDRKQSTSGADVPEKDFLAMKDEKKNNWYPINHQIRLIAGEEYISYWSKLLRNETNENAPDFRSTGYDFKIFDDCAEMMDAIKEKDKEYDGLCRVVSGYGFPFTKSMRDKKGIHSTQDYDFMIDGKKYSWNGINENFATDEKSVSLIGSVFTCQGYDFNYAGVIFSNDIRFNKEKGVIECAPSSYYDKHGKVGTDVNKTIEDIINSYLVLLTRGMKGTYIYCCDKNLKEYLKQKFGKTN